MSYNTGYIESIRRTKYRSFQIGGVHGPTIFQSDDIADYATPIEGDLWIQNDPAGLLQYTNGAWEPIDNAFAAMENPQVLHVSKITHSTTANGAPNKPFNTIQAAHDWAVANVGAGNPVVIMVAPGGYSENVTITRAKTHLRGLAGKYVATAINGSVTINLTASGDWTTNRVSIDGFQLGAPSSVSNVLTLTGSNPIGFYLNNCKVFSAQAGQGCVLVNNTVPAGVRFEVDNCDIQTTNSGVLFDLSNLMAGSCLRRIFSESGSALAIRMRSGNLNLEDSQIGSNLNSVALQVDAGTFYVMRSAVYSNAANSDVFNVASGATLGVSTTIITNPAGTGFAVRGVAGSVYLHANNIYSTNSRVSSAMTSVALTTTVTPA